MIGQIKMDGHLARTPLKGALGDAPHLVMCDAGHNLRVILAKLHFIAPKFAWCYAHDCQLSCQRIAHFITSSLHHFITSSLHHFITSSPHHLITSSPHHLITSSPHHLITSSPHHLIAA